MAAKKKVTKKLTKSPVVIEEERAEETKSPIVVEEEPEKAQEVAPDTVESTPALDEERHDMVQSGESEKDSTMQEENKQEDLRRPESQDSMWSNESPSVETKSGKSKAPVLIFLIVLLALLGAGGTYWYLQGRQATDETLEEELSDELVPMEQPTPTPTVASVNREEWTIDVLNGTGTAGLARKVADELEALGYTIGTVGNATGDYTSSELHVLADDEDAAEGLLSDFKKYGVTSLETDLEDEDSMSVQFIIGDDYSGAEEETSEETEE